MRPLQSTSFLPYGEALTSFAALSSLAVLRVAAQTNLPDVPPGVFNASARIGINTTVNALWNAITNFPAYPDWNTFVLYQFVPLPETEQMPIENKRLIFRVQIPPLPLPVSASTPDNPLHTQFSFENITHVQPELGRLAWKYLAPEVALSSERWTAVSIAADGKALYESREVYDGALATTVEALYGTGLQEAFEGQATALKILLER